jgi:anaerobic magnesium-protoporphyrin IX monomethyl ester cyclase
MRVLLINPQYVPGYIHSARWDGLTISGSHWYPIFLSYCAGLLEKSGHKCKLVDAEAENLSHKQLYSIAKRFRPDFTVIYISEATEEDTKLAEKIKSTGSRIIMVGPWCSMNHEDILKKKSVDHLVDGEFEFAVKDIVDGKLKKRHIVSKRLTQKQLNELPWVTKTYKKHLDIKNYKISSLWYPFVDLFTGRRCCWGKCTFCLWPYTIQKDGGYATRDIEDVLGEIEWIKKNLDVEEIFIQDDTLPGWRAKQLAEGILQRGIKIRWSAYARGDLSMTPEILRLMKKSGCHCLHIGYESGSDKLLKAINKGVTRNNLEKFTKWVNDAKIDIHADFMIGLPGETKKTIRQTIDWAKKLKVMTYQFAPPRLYPCTPFYKWAKSRNYLNENGIMSLPNMSINEIEDWTRTALRECYFNPEFLKRVMFKPREMERLMRSGFYMLSWMITKKAQIIGSKKGGCE